VRYWRYWRVPPLSGARPLCQSAASLLPGPLHDTAPACCLVRCRARRCLASCLPSGCTLRVVEGTGCCLACLARCLLSGYTLRAGAEEGEVHLVPRGPSS